MRSIERHLLIWILGALSIGAIVLVIVSYFVALSEMNELLDGNLKQVALSVASHQQAGVVTEATVTQMAGPPSAEMDFVILTWSTDGRLTFASDPRLVLPFDTAEGPSEVMSLNEAWKVYTVRLGDSVVQAAQRVAAREFEAAEVAAKLGPLLIVLVVLLGLLLVVALRHGLKPLLQTSNYVGQRTATSLEPIPHEEAPRELHSMIHAINRLMQRLSDTFSAQRRFVADAAHELRTPITALKLQAQLLERAQGDGARQLAMRELMEGIDRSKHLIAQLLALSRLEPGAWRHETRPVDIAALVRSVVGRLSIKADANRVDLGADVDGTIVVDADAEQLTVLLNNLVENALRHTPAGGLINVLATREAGKAVLTVVDTGPGIPQEERERVFDRFYRSLDGSAGSACAGASLQDRDLVQGSEAAPGGNGLGLSIVKAIAERHGATVTLHTPAAGFGLEVRVVF